MTEAHAAAPQETSRWFGVLPALGVGLVALVVFPGHQGAYRIAKWGASGVALALLCVGAPTALWRSRSLLPTQRRLLLVGVLFVALSLVGPWFTTPFVEAHIARALRLLLGLAFAYWTGRIVATTHAAARLGALTLVAVASTIATLVLLQAVGSEVLAFPALDGTEFRSPGTLGNPNWAAAYLAPIAPVAFALAHGTLGKPRHLLLSSGALISMAVVATLSKAGMLSLGVGLAALVLFGSRRAREALRQRRVAVAVAILLVGVVVAIAAASAQLETWSWVRGRLFLWECALLAIWEHPFTGLGLGGFLPAYPELAARIIDGDPGVFMPLGSIDFVHHDALQIAAEGGLFTLLGWLWMLWSALAVALRSGQHLQRGIGAGLVVLIAHGLADSPFQLPASFMLLWLFLGWLMATPTSPPTADSLAATKRDRAHRRQRLALASTALLCASLGVVEATRTLVGDLVWTKAVRLLAEGDSRGLDGLQLAATLLPEVGTVRSTSARALARLGRTEEAALELDAARRLRFEFEDAFLALDLANEGRDRATAIAGWQELSLRFPALLTPHYRQAQLQLEAGNPELAIQALRHVVESTQDTPRARALREVARRKLAQLK